MDHQHSITARDLEFMVCDETTEPQALPLSLLAEITDGFSDEQRIGTGGFSVVYKGKLDNTRVAVKRMSNTYMYEKEFHREVECLMLVKHTNVVRFLGYCADTQGSMTRHEGKFIMADVQQRLLCFEHLSKGSLLQHISDTTSGLQWSDRYHILKGICEGLHYLHHKNIVHLDLKPGNILLDGNLVAKIADFGLSRCFGEIQSRVLTQKIGGTLGYLAPEFPNGEITYKFDIYSLGVIIIEVLTGKRGYHAVDKVVKSWSNRLDESHREVQLEQVRVCAEIGIECTNFDPSKRPDTGHIISRLDEIESMDKYMQTCVITSRKIKPDILNGEMHAFWLSYQQLHPDIRRCIKYCSIFPKGSMLRMDELVRLWIAQGFVKTNCVTEDMDDVAEGYIQELVSCSFLQPITTNSGTDCFTVHEVFHDTLDKVAENCYRIENSRSQKGERWKGDVPRDVQHLFVQKYDVELITQKILGLENLRTLIVDVVEDDTSVEEIVMESICKRLTQLRVLAVATSKEHYAIKQLEEFSIPESICQLKHLCYLAFRTKVACTLILPRSLNKLHQVQFLDFGYCDNVDFTFSELTNLRHIICGFYVGCPYNIGRLISLRTIPEFVVRNEQGYEAKQLRELNKLRGRLDIRGLENVRSKEEALEANLAAKERLTGLKLGWGSNDDTRGSPEVEAEVLEGLCPPMGLQTLQICYYKGLRYPQWMVGKQKGGPNNLQQLEFQVCSQQGPAPQFVEAFPHLRVLQFLCCAWNVLPDNMEHLVLLKKLEISFCKNIQSLPTLPPSLEEFTLYHCDDELMESCKTVGHPNWHKIQYIPKKNLWPLSK